MRKKYLILGNINNCTLCPVQECKVVAHLRVGWIEPPHALALPIVLMANWKRDTTVHSPIINLAPRNQFYSFLRDGSVDFIWSIPLVDFILWSRSLHSFSFRFFSIDHIFSPFNTLFDRLSHRLPSVFTSFLHNYYIFPMKQHQSLDSIQGFNRERLRTTTKRKKETSAATAGGIGKK